MRNTLKKAKTQKYKKINVLICYVLLFAYLMVLAFGCNGSSQTASDGFNITDIFKSEAEPVDPLSEAFQIILSGLVDVDPMVRVRAIEVLATTRQVSLMPKVQRLLSDEFTRVRFAAALAVGDLEYSPAERSVRQLLRDENENVRIAAAYALTRLGFPENFELFRNAITSNDQTVRANAAWLLGKSGDKSTLKYLYWAMQHKDSDDKVVYQSAEAIAMLGDRQIYPKLWTMLISAYNDVRVMGVTSMGMLGTPEAKDALITMLDDDVLEVRLVAAQQLGMLKDTTGELEVLDVFEKNLTARMDVIARERVNVLTALAIGRIATPSLAKFLPKLLKSESKFVRLATAKAVFQCTAR